MKKITRENYKFIHESLEAYLKTCKTFFVPKIMVDYLTSISKTPKENSQIMKDYIFNYIFAIKLNMFTFMNTKKQIIDADPLIIYKKINASKIKNLKTTKKIDKTFNLKNSASYDIMLVEFFNCLERYIYKDLNRFNDIEKSDLEKLYFATENINKFDNEINDQQIKYEIEIFSETEILELQQLLNNSYNNYKQLFSHNT